MSEGGAAMAEGLRGRMIGKRMKLVRWATRALKNTGVSANMLKYWGLGCLVTRLPSS
jgi:hypothetical protein